MIDDMDTERRTQERLRELANGGWDEMDPMTRRCMIILADELDAVHKVNRQVRSELADTRKTVIAMMSAIIITVIATGIVNAVWK